MAEGEKVVKTTTITKVKFDRCYEPREPIELPDSIYLGLVKIGAVAKVNETITVSVQGADKSALVAAIAAAQAVTENAEATVQEVADAVTALNTAIEAENVINTTTDDDEAQTIPREIVLEELTVPVLQDMARELDIDIKGKRKADLIADIVAGEEIKKAAEQDEDE